MSNDLLVIVPTRGRPQNVRRLEEARRETRAIHSDFLYAVDDDDPKQREYLALGLDRITLDRRRGLVGSLNDVASRYADRYRFIGFMGDDHLPRTPFWDMEVVKALNTDAPRIVYGNDLLQGARLATAAFMHSRIITAAGYMAPPGLRHLYVDDAWMALGRGLDGLVYLDGVVIEHIHPAAGKAEMDDGYRACNAPDVDHADHEEFLRWQDYDLPTVLDRVRKEYRL